MSLQYPYTDCYCQYLLPERLAPSIEADLRRLSGVREWLCFHHPIDRSIRTLELSGGYVGGRVNKLQSTHSKYRYRRSNNRSGKRLEFSTERPGSDGRGCASQRALVHLGTLEHLGYLGPRRLIRIDSKPDLISSRQIKGSGNVATQL